MNSKKSAFQRGCLLIGAILGPLTPAAWAQSTNWNQTSAGTYNWQTAGNWTPSSVPGGLGATANLTNDIAGNQTIQLNGAVTLGTLNIGDASGSSAFTLAAGTGGTLTMDVSSGSASINKATGTANDLIDATIGITINDNLVLANSVAANTLTIAGGITDGTSAYTLTKNGVGLVALTGNNSYDGVTTVSAGTLEFSGASGVNSGTNAYSISSGATLSVDNTSANNNTRIYDSSAITVVTGGSLVYKGSTSGNSSETVGTINVGSSTVFGPPGTITLSYGGVNTATLTASSMTRNTAGSVLVNGVSLGKDTASTSASRLILTSAPSGVNLVGTTSDGGTGINPAVKNAKIVPWLLGEATQTSGGLGTATGTANTFLTYNSGSGLRPLNPTDEFGNNVITTGDNTYITANTTASGSAAINSVVINGGDLSIADGQTLTNTSAAILFVTSNAIKPTGTTGALSFGSGAEAVITVNPGVSATVSSAITATGVNNLGKIGAGTLTLSGNNTYSGTTRVSAGTLILSGNNTGGGSISLLTGELVIASTNAIPAASLTTFSGGTLSTSLGSITLNNNIGLNGTAFIGSASNTGSFVLNGTLIPNAAARTLTPVSGVTVTINSVNALADFTPATPATAYTFNGPGSFVINSSNAFGGGATIGNTATVTVGDKSALGPGNLTLTGNNSSSGAILKTSTGLTGGNAIANSWALGGGSGSAIIFSGANSIELSGAYRGRDSTAILINNLDAGKTLILSGTIGIASAATSRNLTLNGTGDTLISGSIANNAAGGTSTSSQLILGNTGTTTLSGVNTYGGATTVSAGTLRLANVNALPGGIGSAGGTSNLTVSGGAVIELAADSFFRGTGITATNVNLSGAGGGGFSAYGANRIVNLGGATGQVTWASSSFIGTGSPLVLGSASANAQIDFQNPIALGSAVRTIQVNDNPNSTADQALISGAITSSTAGNGLVKTGAGTLILGTTNTFTGATTISNGVLLVNGATTNSAMTVVSSAVLGGTGNVGLVVVNGGGALSANGTNTIGTLTVTNLTLAENAIIYWNYDATTADLINVTGALTLPTNATIYAAGTGALPSSGQIFSLSSGSIGGATNLNWTINGSSIKATTHVVRSGNHVNLVTSSGSIITLK